MESYTRIKKVDHRVRGHSEQCQLLSLCQSVTQFQTFQSVFLFLPWMTSPPKYPQPPPASSLKELAVCLCPFIYDQLPCEWWLLLRVEQPSILTQVPTANKAGFEEPQGTCFYSMSEMAAHTKFVLWLLLLSGSSLCFGSDPDVQCLKTVQQSVIDPNDILKSSWIFDNTADGFICRFTGVECWHPYENRVLTLRLSNLGLQGQFPQGLEKCTSMTGLDLSSNNFSGSIPSDIGWQLSILTSLDLSYNDFSGEIPVGILNITYLNSLYLQHNQLSGPIPEQLGELVPGRSVLPRLQSFSVADNQLSGPIPLYLQMFHPLSFAGNQGLCDRPLADCARRRLHRINDESSIGAAAGFVVGFVVAFYFPRCFIFSKSLHPYVFHI